MSAPAVWLTARRARGLAWISAVLCVLFLLCVIDGLARQSQARTWQDVAYKVAYGRCLEAEKARGASLDPRASAVFKCRLVARERVADEAERRS